MTRIWFAFVCSLRVLLDARFAARAWAVRDGLPSPTSNRRASGESAETTASRRAGSKRAAPRRESEHEDSTRATAGSQAPLGKAVESPAAKGNAAKSSATRSSAANASKESHAEPEGVAGEADEAAGAPDLSSALVLLSLLQREGRLVDFLEQEVSGFDDAEIGAAVRVVHEGCRKVLHQHAVISPVRAEEEESRVEVTDGVSSGAIKLTGKLHGAPPYRGVLRHRGWRIAELSLPTPVVGHDPSVIAPAEVEL